MLELNKIYCIDCVEGMRRLDENIIDLVVTSPPYDNMRTYNGHSFDFKNTAQELYQVISIGGVVVWVIGDETINGSETGTSFRQALYFIKCGFNLFDTMIYAKPPRGAVGNNKAYWQSFEFMFVFAKGKPKTINLICDRKNKESRKGDRSTKRLPNGKRLRVKRGGYGEVGRRTNIWEYAIGKGHSTKDNFAFEHPAIFPEKLVEDHILSWSNEGDIVLDPMCGSGTTCKMANILNRKFIGFDINQDYVKIAEKRSNQNIL